MHALLFNSTLRDTSLLIFEVDIMFDSILFQVNLHDLPC